jgi:NAD(P)-dependent dehydrogenase (short-subunit alcohol dehydrogenase family)
MMTNDGTVLVTGASRGLGRAIAEEFARQGWTTYGVARSAAEVPGVRMARLDCTDEAAVTRFIHALPALDVVVNNAGIARYRPLLETPTAELREILEVNVIAPFVVLRESARRMVKSGGGHVINIASDAALTGIAQMAPYVASKHALLGIGRSASQEFRRQGVRVTTYCPGPIDTEILGHGNSNPNALSPADLSRTIVHLASLPDNVEVQELLVRPRKM